jgi:hypothetical protein
MFQTIGRTWELARASWRVLMQDKELLLFPVLTFLSVAAIVGIFAAIALGTGTIDHLRDDGDRNVRLIDVVLLVLMVVAATFSAIFFNAALVAAAMERLRGGDPNVVSGIRAILPYTHNILGWAIIAASVGLVLQAVRSRTDGLLGRLVLSLIGGVWAYMTFFVVPVLVAKGYSPVGAIKESGSLFKRTWGEQVTANFGFGIFYLGALAIVAVPALLLGAAAPIAGIVVGVLLAVLALSAVAATEGIFKAALYRYAAEGVASQGFEHTGLATSYGPRPTA